MIGIARPILDRFNQGLSNSHPHKRYAAARAAQDAVGTGPATTPGQAGEEELEISASLLGVPSRRKRKVRSRFSWPPGPMCTSCKDCSLLRLRSFIAWMLRVIADAHGRSVNTRI
jgi:hypothetical protein